MNEDTLLEIKLALQGLQITQQQILEKVNDIKSDHKELAERVDEMDRKIQYAVGFAVPVIAFVAFMSEWVKAKFMGVA